MVNKALRNELVTICSVGVLGALLLGKPRIAAGIGAVAAGAFLLTDPPFSFFGTSVVIMGGSRGLGLEIAKELVAEGALVTLLATDSKELDRARQLLLVDYPQGRVHTVVYDVTQEQSVAAAFEESVAVFGGVDVLINSAGVIPPYTLLRQMKRIVNIYPFANLEGRIEHGSVPVTMVYSAQVDSWNESFPGLSMSAQRVAKKTIQACRDGQRELIPSRASKARLHFAVIFPEIAIAMRSLTNRFLISRNAKKNPTNELARKPSESMKDNIGLLH